MKSKKIALLGLLVVGAAGGWSSLSAQNYPPPPPPRPYDQPQQQPYDNRGYDNRGYDSRGYDNRGYDNQGYDNQGYDQPYYDDQGPENSYDNAPDPGYYDQGDYNQGSADVSVFYGNLSPYGRWIQRASYGWVWEPTRVRVGWRPYTVGHWVQSDYGWTWISDEPWGWATYHYGRWLSDPEYGWLWVPGTEWGPAWCSFQEGNGYIGWAPLPPSVGFQASVGIRIGGLSFSASLTPYAYSFVPERLFLAPRLDSYIEPPARNVTFIRNTRNITNITVVNNRIVNQSVPVQRIEQVTGQRVRRFQIDEVRNPAQARTPQVQGDRIAMFRPAARLAPAPAQVTPQAVIQRRAQRQQQPGLQPQPVPGQDQGGRWRRQQPQPVQPGQPARPEAAQPEQQGPQGQPRWQQRQGQVARPMPAPQDLERKHQAEEQQLQNRQQQERQRVQQAQQNEQRDRQNQARSQEIAAQHQAEAKALADQQRQEQQLLRARQQRERQAPQARQAPPQDRGQQQQQQQQQQDRRNRNQDQKDQKDQKDRQDRRPQPPPPPPGR